MELSKKTEPVEKVNSEKQTGDLKETVADVIDDDVAANFGTHYGYGSCGHPQHGPQRATTNLVPTRLMRQKRDRVVWGYRSPAPPDRGRSMAGSSS